MIGVYRPLMTAPQHSFKYRALDPAPEIHPWVICRYFHTDAPASSLANNEGPHTLTRSLGGIFMGCFIEAILALRQRHGLDAEKRSCCGLEDAANKSSGRSQVDSSESAVCQPSSTNVVRPSLHSRLPKIGALSAQMILMPCNDLRWRNARCMLTGKDIFINLLQARSHHRSVPQKKRLR